MNWELDLKVTAKPTAGKHQSLPILLTPRLELTRRSGTGLYLGRFLRFENFWRVSSFCKVYLFIP